jgi:hypothetical protein
LTNAKPQEPAMNSEAIIAPNPGVLEILKLAA